MTSFGGCVNLNIRDMGIVSPTKSIACLKKEVEGERTVWKIQNKQ